MSTENTPPVVFVRPGTWHTDWVQGDPKYYRADYVEAMLSGRDNTLGRLLQQRDELFAENQRLRERLDSDRTVTGNYMTDENGQRWVKAEHFNAELDKQQVDIETLRGRVDRAEQVKPAYPMTVDTLRGLGQSLIEVADQVGEDWTIEGTGGFSMTRHGGDEIGVSPAGFVVLGEPGPRTFKYRLDIIVREPERVDCALNDS